MQTTGTERIHINSYDSKAASYKCYKSYDAFTS
jgi:hypothetical protein